MNKVIAALAATKANRGETQTLEQASRTGGSRTGGGTAAAKTQAATVAPKSDPLSKEERVALKKFEGVIESGIKVFIQVGNALTAIRDERLYRETHPTFEAYCRDRWGFSKTHANRLIQSANVAKNLTPIGVVPTSESQVRVLSSLAPTDQVKVFKNALKAAEGVATHVTAKALTDAAAKLGLKTVSPQASTAGNVSAGTPRHNTDKLVARDVVVEAVTTWAEDHWEKVSQLSVADFITAFKGVIATI